MKALPTVLVSGLAVLSSAQSLAHHSFSAQYDPDKPITLEGIVTKVEWMNPHARFYIDVQDEAGAKTNWNLELASPNVLKRNGWSSTSLKTGDRVTVEGALARDGSNMANARVVTFASGERVFGRSAADENR